jgi:hypothetical protein
MKWKFMGKTVGMLLAVLGLAELPVNAETKEMNLTAEQDEMAKKLLGLSYEEAKASINAEIKASVENDFDLKAVEDELAAMRQKLALDAKEKENPSSRPDASLKEQFAELNAKLAERDELFKALIAEGVGDTGKVIQLNKSQMRQHSSSHLNASGKDFDAFEQRPWNERAAGIKAGSSNFNDQVDVPVLQGDMEHFVRENPKVLESIFEDVTGLPAEWGKLTGIIDRVVSGVVMPSEITQGNQDGWNPKGSVLIEAEEGRVYEKKVDITLRGYQLKKIETMWISWMNGNDGSHPWKTTFVGFLLGEFMKQQMLDSRIAQINGIYVKTPAGNDLAGANINSQNGLRYLWWYYRDVLKQFKPFDIGEPTEENIVDYVEKMIMGIPEHKRDQQGYEIQLSHNWLKAYRSRAGELYVMNYNTDSGKYEYKEMFPVDRPNFKFQPLLDQTNTNFIGITKSKNVEVLEYMENEKGEYTMIHEKRDTNIFMDFREGIRFVTVGRKLLPGDPKEFEYQRVYSNASAVFGSDVKVPLFDDKTGILKLKYPQYYPHVRIVQDDFSKDIADVEGAIPGMVVTITGNASLSAARKVKRNAKLLLDTADFELNTGGTLYLLVQEDGKLKELRRTATPETAASTDKTFATAIVDAKEGSVFRFNGVATTAITSVINGVENKVISIYGTDAVGVDVTLSTTGNIKVDSAATLASEADYIQLTYVGGTWYESKRVIA